MKKINKSILITLIFGLIFLSFVYKLDYAGFFTDEILYVDAGREHLTGAYTESMQVPLVPKYLAGVMYLISNRSIYLMRLPFALMGIVTAIVIYKILAKEYDYRWGLAGAVLYATSRIIYDATRMVMLEPLLHLGWTLFLYYHFEAIKTFRPKAFVIAGIFFGVAFMAKITSVILIPFTLFFIPYHLLKQKHKVKRVLANYLAMYAVGGILVTSTYIDAFRKTGEKTTFFNVLNGVRNTYWTKNSEGKSHIINDVIYTKSPGWTYGYYFLTRHGIVKTVLYSLSSGYAVLNRNLFVSYWGLFFALAFIFYQVSAIKSERYVSSFEIPLIVLSVSGFYFLSKKWSKFIYLVFGLIIFLTITHSVYVLNQPKTAYNALFSDYISRETNNFTSSDKIYIYGSMRSARWYKHGKGIQMFEISQDYEKTCPRFKEFNYFIFETKELQRYGSNLMFEYVSKNADAFGKEEKFGFAIYKQKPGTVTKEVCLK